MLEDIRDHSPIPQQQEIEWMAARPMNAVVRVLVLTLVAAALSLAGVEMQQATPKPTVAQASAVAPSP